MTRDTTEKQAPRSALDPGRQSIAQWWGELRGKMVRDYSLRKVLVADDEPLILTMLERVLVSSIGCQATLVEDGDEVVRHLERESCDVLIADMIMPGLHGLDLISTVRERWPDVDIIVLTGFPDVFPYVEVIRAGASDFIAKPHPPREIEAKLLRLFDERELREQLMLAEAKYRSLFDKAVFGELILKTETYEIVDANGAFCELSGHKREVVVGSALVDLLDAGARQRFEQAVGVFAAGGQGSLSDITLLHADGRKLIVDVTVSFIAVPFERIVFLSVRDVTEKRRVVDQLAVAAQTDSMTGLANKRTLLGRLEGLLPHARREGEPIALLFIDLDDFKGCNDTHGHETGDRVLEAVGAIIRKCIRDGRGDEGFRYGGDEFAVLLGGTPANGATVVAERIRAEFEAEDHFGVTLSIGVAQFQEDMEPTGLIQAADGALYEAKAQGKNSVHSA